MYLATCLNKIIKYNSGYVLLVCSVCVVYRVFFKFILKDINFV